MVFDAEKEIQWLRTEALPKMLTQKKIVRSYRICEFRLFKILNIDVEQVHATEAFMLTTCYRAAVKYKFKYIHETLYLFVKKTPTVPQHVYNGINYHALFSNEILAYEIIIPRLISFANLPFQYVKFYYGETHTDSAVIVTEDFTKRGWRVPRLMTAISVECMFLGIEYLGEFHAFAFGWRKMKALEFQYYTKDLKEARYHSVVHPSWITVLKASKNRALMAARKYEPTIKKEFLEKLDELWGNPYEYCKQRIKPREPLVTLCHGDYLRNNIAYLYDVDDEATDIMMFDLQTLRLASPMLDLTVFLALSVTADMRYHRQEELFQLYVESLQRTYRKVVRGVLPEYLSHESLIREYIKFMPYGISISAAFLMNLVEPNTETTEEMLMAVSSEEQTIHRTMTKGGELVDRELAHQIKELYELADDYSVNVFEPF